MSEEEILLLPFKSKIGYCFTYKDLEEVDTVIKLLLSIQEQLSKKEKIIDELKKIYDIPPFLDKIKNIDEYSVNDENEEFVKWVMNLETENKQLKEQNQKAIDKLNSYDFDKLVYTKTKLKEDKKYILDILHGKEDK